MKQYYQFDILDNVTFYQGVLEEETESAFVLSEASKYTKGKKVGTNVAPKDTKFSLLKDKVIGYQPIESKQFSV